MLTMYVFWIKHNGMTVQVGSITTASRNVCHVLKQADTQV